MLKFIDTHCHLDDAVFDGKLEKILINAQSVGVKTFIVPSASLESMQKVKHICQTYDCCLPAYGIHPFFITPPLHEGIYALEQLLEDNSAVAIGEIGIDLYNGKENLNHQETYFCAQLDIARRHSLPVLLHMRKSIENVFTLLTRYKINRGIAHAFSGSLEQAHQFIKKGFKIGIGGVVTRPNAHKLRHIAASLPAESIVLETDSPFLPPVWLKNQPNTPASIPEIANVVASLRKMSLEELAYITTKNALDVLEK